MQEKLDSLLSRFRPLSHHVNKELKETLFKNEAYLDNRSSFLEASVVSWSNSYKKYLLLLVFLCLIISINAYLWMSYITVYAEIKPDSSLLGILLTGQITIVGLIYPLVISLVSILFQDKAGKKVIFSLYQKYSGFMFAGLSGLSLAIILAFSLIFNTILSEKLSLVINTTLTFWFIFNLFLTVWFFIKTLSILNENKKDEFIFRFVTNEVCKSDLKQRIRKIYLEDLFQNGLLKGVNSNVLDLSNSAMLNTYDKEISCIISKDKELYTVSLWKLNLAIWLQAKVLKRFKNELTNCRFYVCIPIFADRDKKVTLVKYSGFDINPLVSFLIKSSVKYDKKSNKTDISISSALEAFTSPIHTALSNNDERDFIESLDRLAKYHIQLAEVLSFENSNGKSDNWLLLNEGTWGFSYFTNFMRTYYVLLKQTVDKIPSNTQYFYHTLCFYRKIFFEQKYIIQSETETVLRNTLYLYVALLKWKNLSDKTDLAVNDGFDDAIHKFVSVWEEWKNFYIKYKHFNRPYLILFEHLKYTAEMVVESLKFDNEHALGWSIDMLIHWKDVTLDIQNHNEEFLWHSKIIDIELLHQENANFWSKIRKGNNENLESAINIALKNAYVDIRFLTACFILGKSDNLLTIKPYIDALLKEERVYPTGTNDTQVKSINQASQLLEVYIRHKRYYLSGRESFYNWQTQLLENYNRKFSQKMISGRMYSGWHDISIDDEFVQLAVSYSPSKWKLSGACFDVLKSNVYSFSNREDMTRNFKALIETSQNISDYKLLSSEINIEAMENYRVNFIDSMEDLVNEINQINNDHVINSGIDNQVLLEIAKAASNDFIADEINFPLNMFDVINKDGIGLIINNRIIAEDFKKFYIMSNDRPEIDNMVESHGEVISSYLKNILLNEIILTDLTDEQCFNSIENMLLYVFNSTKKSNKVLLCHPSICSLISNLYEDEKKRNIFQIVKNYSTDYFCKIGDCKVYNHSFGIINSCAFTTVNKFKSLIIEDFEEDSIVEIGFNEYAQDKTRGDLFFNYKLEIKTDVAQPFIKLSLILEDFKSDEEATKESIDIVIQRYKPDISLINKINRSLKLFLKY